MKTYSFNLVVTLLFSFFSLNACSNPETGGADQGNSNIKTASINEISFPTETPAKFKVLKFNINQLPELDFEGEIQAGACWQDGVGLNYYIVTLQKTSEGSRIWQYHFYKESKNARWYPGTETKTDGHSPIEDIHIGEQHLEISDLDGDNFAEVAFSHHSMSQDKKPIGIEARLLVIKENAISNSFLLSGGLEFGPNGDIVPIPYNSIFPGFDDLPLLLQEHLKKKYESHEAMLKKELEKK